MAKKKETYPYKSLFGTHANMVVSTDENEGTCICEDEYGTYTTKLTCVDSGLADPSRFDLVSRGINLSQRKRKK